MFEQGTIRIEKSAVVLVEGKGDVDLFEALFDEMGLKDAWQIVPVGGDSQIRPGLLAAVNAPGFSQVNSLLVVRDGDKDPSMVFGSICGALRAAQEKVQNIGIPGKPFEIVESGEFRLAAAVLPDGKSKGNLEDLCLRSVEGTAEMDCVAAFESCVLEVEGIEIKAVSSKARTQVYLACKPRPSLGVGPAAKKGYWNLGHECFDQLRELVRQFQKG